ncbi:MAG TPA: sulfatase [Chthonomonadales bacterium]|nr:sulfatase [Chthonomonadales bacterium]
MRILYLDIDSLRPDHLGCYGYHRATSPNIDRVAQAAIRFEWVYASDAPCLPSRTAMWSGRFGIHNGVINHGGVASEPFLEGPGRSFASTLSATSWMRALRKAGHYTATISPFGERHAAWHWYANFNEVYNTGKGGMERADEIAPVALDWLRRNGRREDWFLHVNLWDPHTPYRTPAGFPNPFEHDPLPGWLTNEVREQHWNGCGPHSAREILGYDDSSPFSEPYPLQPSHASSMAEVRRMFDGYDMGVRYADMHIGHILNSLADLGVLEDTAILISADHGEALGELNVYGDHQLADEATTHIPCILSWPGRKSPGVDTGLHYNVDIAATIIQLTHGAVPQNWDGAGFASQIESGTQTGREYLVISQGAWSCQRSVRWADYLCVRSYHDGLHAFPDIMLFDLAADPHQQHNAAPLQSALVAEAALMLEEWRVQMIRAAGHTLDPMDTVLAEGGPFHTRGCLPAYLHRLRETGRGEWAERLERNHPLEAAAAQ